VFLLAVLTVAGCAHEPTLGELTGQPKRPIIEREFDPPPAGSLVLGRTTFAEARIAAPAKPGVWLSRELELYFSERVLVGYQFRSTLKGEETDFDESRVGQIEQGVTMSAQVIALPIGLRYDYQHVRLVCGADLTPQERAVQSLVARAVGASLGPPGARMPRPTVMPRFYAKSLLVVVGSADVVTDVQLAVRGSR
jgi:hypothetical protein